MKKTLLPLLLAIFSKLSFSQNSGSVSGGFLILRQVGLK